MPKLLSYETYTVAAAGATKAFDVDNTSTDVYKITTTGGGAVALAADMIFTTSGTLRIGQTFVFLYGGQVTIGGFNISFFGTTLSAAQALYEAEITAYYNGTAWEIRVLSDMTTGNVDLNGANIVAGSIPVTALTNSSITLAKMAVLAGRGYLIRGDANGALGGFNAVTSGNLVMGNGTDITSLAMSGDATINGTGVITIANDAVTTAKILNANITTAKLATALATQVVTIACSFEAGEVGAIKFKMPYPGSITNVYAIATKAIANTDAGTVVFKDNAGTTMTVTTPISFAASDPFGTAYSSNITANNTFVASDLITVLTAKPTAGGKVLLSLTILRS